MKKFVAHLILLVLSPIVILGGILFWAFDNSGFFKE